MTDEHSEFRSGAMLGLALALSAVPLPPMGYRARLYRKPAKTAKAIKRKQAQQAQRKARRVTRHAP